MSKNKSTQAQKARTLARRIDAAQLEESVDKLFDAVCNIAEHSNEDIRRELTRCKVSSAFADAVVNEVERLRKS
jgi:hypothetical protein